jgi:phage baseplate assembly protein W
MARAFAIEDGKINTRTLVSTRSRDYIDIDLTLNRIPGTTDTDILKKKDAAAVKQSVKNLLLTNRTEKPFKPAFGGNLNELLFTLDTEFDADLIEEYIASSMKTHEPRALLRKVDIVERPDYNEVLVTVYFQVVSTQELVSLQINLTRLR